MPIQAAANKLAREIDLYGLESCMAGDFDAADEEARMKAVEREAAAAAANAEAKIPSKSFKGIFFFIYFIFYFSSFLYIFS